MKLLLTIGIVFVIVEITMLKRKVKGLEATVSLLNKQLDLNEDSEEPLTNREDAIKTRKAKETFGLSLVEAQQYLNDLRIEKSQEK